MNDSHWFGAICISIGAWVPYFLMTHFNIWIPVVITAVIFLISIGISMGESK